MKVHPSLAAAVTIALGLVPLRAKAEEPPALARESSDVSPVSGSKPGVSVADATATPSPTAAPLAAPATALDAQSATRFQIERPSIIRALPDTQPPPGYESGRRYNKALLVLGSASLLVGYGSSVLGSSLRGQHGGKRFIPIVGPFLPGVEAHGCDMCQLPGGMLTIFGALGQVVGILGLTVAVATPTYVYERKDARAKPLKMAVVPFLSATDRGVCAILHL